MQNFQEPVLWKVMDSCFISFISICKCCNFKIFSLRLLACLNFTLDSEDLLFWYKLKKKSVWAMVIVQAAENHGDELGFADLSIDHKDCAN